MLLISGMEESGSEGLDELLISRKDTPFMKDVDYVCISDNYWLGKEKPCLTYGLRGICYFFIEVQCCAKDLHSGVFGGTVHEGMADLIYMMNTLLDKGKFSYMTSASADCPPVVVGTSLSGHLLLGYPSTLRKSYVNGTIGRQHPRGGADGPSR